MLDVLLQQVRVIDEVLGAHEADAAVDNHELAVIAQVRPPKTPTPGLQRQHQMPIYANLRESPAQREVALVFPRTHLVKQQADLHAAGGGALQCLEKHVGAGVPGHDIDLDVHVFLRLVDHFGHTVECGPVIRVQADDRAWQRGHAGEAAIQLDHRTEFRADVFAVREVR